MWDRRGMDSNQRDLDAQGVELAQSGDAAAALELYRQALELFDREVDASEAALTQMHVGMALSDLGRREEALAAIEEASAAFLQQEEFGGVAICSQNAGLVLCDLGRLPEAAAHHSAALDFARSIDDPEMIAECLLNVGLVDRKRGNFEAALAHFTEAADRFTALGDVGRSAGARLGVGTMLDYLQRHVEAFAQFEAIHSIEVGMEKWWSAARAANLAASALLGAGDFEAALEWADRAVEEVAKLDEPEATRVFDLFRVFPLVELGRVDEAVALTATPPVDDELENQAWIERACGRVAVEVGDAAWATNHYQLAVELFTEFGDVVAAKACAAEAQRLGVSVA